MSELFGLLFGAVLVNNLVLTTLVGLDLQVTASQRMHTAWLLGLATLYCLSLCLPGAYLIDHLLIIPLQLQYLDLLFYMMLIMGIVYASQKVVALFFPLLSEHVNAIVPVILVNSIFLAVILLSQDQSLTFFGSFYSGVGTGTGFLFLLLVLTCLRERIDNDDVPVSFRGLPILLMALGIFSMGLMGLAGLK
jgi:electron transport complex protein RnfA